MDENNFCKKKCGKNEFWLGEEKNDCLECHYKIKNCSEFEGLGSCEKCLKCDQGLFLEENSCVSKCSQKYFYNKTTESCEKCPKNCASCSSGSNCTKCEQGFFNEKQQTCVERERLPGELILLSENGQSSSYFKKENFEICLVFNGHPNKKEISRDIIEKKINITLISKTPKKVVKLRVRSVNFDKNIMRLVLDEEELLKELPEGFYDSVIQVSVNMRIFNLDTSSLRLRKEEGETKEANPSLDEEPIYYLKLVGTSFYAEKGFRDSTDKWLWWVRLLLNILAGCFFLLGLCTFITLMIFIQFLWLIKFHDLNFPTNIQRGLGFFNQNLFSFGSLDFFKRPDQAVCRCLLFIFELKLIVFS